jgi:GT2 family glycosyltransferase
VIYHAVAMMAYNNLRLTKAALNSLVVQDIGPLEFWILDNGSSDGTHEWLDEFAEFVDDVHRVHVLHNAENLPPTQMSNRMLKMVFDAGHEKVLCVANDVVLPPNMYRLLAQRPRGMVTASQTGTKEFPPYTEAHAVAEHTPAAVALIRRWFYDALMARDGYFLDERFTHYASDCDFALRMASCGIRGVQLDVQYYHVGSATLKLAQPDEQRRMQREADVDRQKFIDKWGFPVDDLEYGRLAGDIDFMGEKH